MRRKAWATVRAERAVVAGFCLGSPVASLLLVRSPLLISGFAAVASFMTFAITSPASFIASVAFLSAAVPKAGFLVGNLPVPLMMFVLLAGAFMLRQSGKSHGAGIRLIILSLLWLGYRLLALCLYGGTLTDIAALAGWYGLPLVLLMVGPAAGSLRGRTCYTWNRWLETGILMACLFGVLQKLAGLERTAVPGVTRAVGSDYSSKPLTFAGGSKIPSTYQNGNILGVVTGVFFLISALRVLSGRGSRRDHLIMAATATATLLSGSRTSVIGMALGLGVLMVRSGLRRQTIAIFALCTVVVGFTLYLSPALSDRLIGTSVSDPALAQRTVIWSHVLSSTSFPEFLTGGAEWANPSDSSNLADGFIGIVQQVGIIGLALLIGVFVVITKPPLLRKWRLLLLPLVVSLAADSAYLVFPTLFLPIARMFAPIDVFAESSRKRISNDGRRLSTSRI